MSTIVKVLLVAVIGITVLCVVTGAAGLILIRAGGKVVGQAVQSDQASEVAESIAEFSLPADFGEAYAKQVAGFDLVSYTGKDGHSHVIFFQLPPGIRVNPEEIERQMHQARGEANYSDRKIRTVDQFPATVSGQETTVLVSEGVNSDDQAYRQVSAVFQGNGGQALVVFERPVNSWDQAEVEAFIASIR